MKHRRASKVLCDSRIHIKLKEEFNKMDLKVTDTVVGNMMG